MAGMLPANAAEPSAAPATVPALRATAPVVPLDATQATSIPAPTGGAAAVQASAAATLPSGPLLAASTAGEAQLEADYYPSQAAGICPVIDDLVQQSCAQYPGDPSCRAQ